MQRGAATASPGHHPRARRCRCEFPVARESRLSDRKLLKSLTCACSASGGSLGAKDNASCSIDEASWWWEPPLYVGTMEFVNVETDWWAGHKANVGPKNGWVISARSARDCPKGLRGSWLSFPSAARRGERHRQARVSIGLSLLWQRTMGKPAEQARCCCVVAICADSVRPRPGRLRHTMPSKHVSLPQT